MEHPIKKLSKIRLLKWYVVSFILLLIITLLSPQQLPVVVYKLSLVLLSAVVGYHLDRALFPYSSPGSYLCTDWKKDGKNFYQIKYKKDGRLYDKSNANYLAEYPVLEPYRMIFAVVLIRRALIVFAVILGVTLGL
ncbi:putative holin [Gilliamella bombi]|uniref:putative holin n=1 Tax=Gilliamella bombi TaxID=1908521 RepID=UPI000A1534C3|nr:putative holin [Gilliamella bombi]